MIDREVVIRELTQLIARADYIKTVWLDSVSVPMLRGALELLKEQEPRVLTLEELRSLDGTDHFVWLEDNGEYDLYDCYAEVTTYQNNVELNTFGREVEFEPDNEEYGKTWRCWSARPSNAQRMAVKWDMN